MGLHGSCNFIHRQLRNTIVKKGMNTFPKNRNLPLLKYSVLKPTSSLTSLKRTLARPHPRCPYELAATAALSVRKYRRTVQNLDSMMQEYQWRQDQRSPIVHCLYIQLLPPTSSRGVGLDIYIEDMEITLSRMGKLILPEAVFLIQRAAEGYRALHERFKEVSVGEETIGLNCSGQCIVWTNPALERNHPDDCRLAKPQEIVREVVELVREKSEPVCQGVLGKLLESLREGGDFRRMQAIIEGFVKSCKVVVPNDLRYLVHQERVTKNCEGIKTQRSVHEEKQRDAVSRRFIVSRDSLASLHLRSPRQASKSSPRGFIASTLRKTTSPHSNLMTYRSNQQQHQSVDSSLHGDPKGSKFHQSVADPQKLFPFLHSRSKSQSYECIQIINNIRPKKTEVARSNGEIKEMKKASNISENAKTAQTLHLKTQLSENGQSSVGSGLVPASPCTRPPLALYSSKEFQSFECSPFIIKEEEPHCSSTNLLPESSDFKFQAIPEFFRANKWTPTLRTLLEARSDLNTSITEGQDANAYLSDVRLQRLECLSKHMVVSLIPSK